MKRFWIIFFLVSTLITFLGALSWSGARFFAYVAGKEELSLRKQPLQSAQLGESVSLELQGTGFDHSIKVQLVMDVNNHDALVGSFPFEGSVYDMLQVDDRLYVASNQSGLLEFDVSQPAAPAQKSIYLARAAVLDIEQYGKSYILSCADQGIYIYKPTERGNLKRERHLYSWSPVVETRVVDNYLYAAGSKKGLYVYDLKDADEDRPKQVIDVGGSVFGVETYLDYIYVVGNFPGMQIYQSLGTGELVHVDEIPFETNVRDVLRYEDRLYILKRNGLSVYRLSMAGIPELLADNIFIGNPDHLYGADNILYVSDSSKGLSLLNMSEPDGAFVSFDVGGNPHAIVSRDNYLYVFVSKFGIRVVDLQTILPTQLALQVATPGKVWDLFVDDRWVYISDGIGGLRVYDQSQESNESQVLSPNGRSIHAAGDFLFAVSVKLGIDLFSISDQGHPELVVSWHKLTGANSLARIDDYLVLAKGTEGLALVDIRDLNNPKIIETISSLHATKVIAHDGIFYVAGDRGGVLIYQVSKQGHLEMLGKIAPPFPMNEFTAATSLEVVQGVAYITNGYGGLIVADVRNPRQPKIISTIGLPGYATSLDVHDNRVYVACRFSGVQIVNISNLKQLRLENSIAFPGLESGIQVANGLIFLGNGYRGLTAFPVPQTIENYKILSNQKLQVVLPSPKIPGRYSLHVSNREQSVSLDGVVQFEAGQNL